MRLLDEAAFDVPEKILERHFKAAYGIFAGKVKVWAVLHFSPERSRLVRGEAWYLDQVGEMLNDGS